MAGSSCDDVVVVGAGPAGLTAAIYLGRLLRTVRVLDAGASRARWIPESNNCPGFPQGIAGIDLLARLREQATSFGARFESATVTSLLRDGDGFQLADAQGHRWRAPTVILATGLADRLPDVDDVEGAIACGALRLCPVCDAYEVTDRNIGIHGPWASIVSHARFLRGYSARLTLLPTDTVGTLDGEGGLDARVLPAGGQLVFDGRRCGYAVDGDRDWFDTVYPFLGSRSSARLAQQAGVTLTGTGEIPVDRSHQTTGVPGLYAIGDVVSGLNQISVAVGQAAVAALDAHARLPFVPRR
ncbi:NAD(P)/FAD-dependent oxidoreductase [Pseudoxanthomonas daejeonensis]|uniref:Pyridine nucleotide-disulfide oxidoreductase n=1 Tax=Pseudoxanthomonas daejeonensis TaxID=266062 RepID=A0ABQ6Z3W3_9GAMM|nr:NAD(P)/FAD-dependent oxidoreductase [Pseudoxanthomonas daejeonensis]KAF1692400.1 pyridine nucleotide-disulfide oxidoreductase [Pseudoxanthomonas daejeonensis]